MLLSALGRAFSASATRNCFACHFISGCSNSGMMKAQYPAEAQNLAPPRTRPGSTSGRQSDAESSDPAPRSTAAPNPLDNQQSGLPRPSIRRSRKPAWLGSPPFALVHTAKRFRQLSPRSNTTSRHDDDVHSTQLAEGDVPQSEPYS